MAVTPYLCVRAQIRSPLIKLVFIADYFKTAIYELDSQLFFNISDVTSSYPETYWK